jgi:hypothetical protein
MGNGKLTGLERRVLLKMARQAKVGMRRDEKIYKEMLKRLKK